MELWMVWKGVFDNFQSKFGFQMVVLVCVII